MFNHGVVILRSAQPFREFVKVAREWYSEALRPQSCFEQFRHRIVCNDSSVRASGR